MITSQREYADMLLAAAGVAQPAALLLLQCTLLALAGLAISHAVRRRGPFWQNHLLRGVVVAVPALVLLATVAGSHIQPLGAVEPVAALWQEGTVTVPEPEPVQSIKGADTKPATSNKQSDVPSVADVPAPAQPTPAMRYTVPASVICWDAFLLIWTLGSVFLALRMLGGYVWLARCHRNAMQSARASQMLQELHPAPQRLPTVVVAPDVDSPFLAGIWKQTVFLPTDDLPEPELRLVLAHEWTHFHRSDCAWKAASQLLTVLLWFSPALHLVGKQLEETSEACCDACVLQTIHDPRDYASCLLNAAERWTGKGRERVLGTGVLSRGSMMAQRIQSIISGRARAAAPRGMARWGLVATVAAVVVACLLLVGPKHHTASDTAAASPSQPVATPVVWTPPAGYAQNFTAFPDAQPATLVAANGPLPAPKPKQANISQVDKLLLRQLADIGHTTSTPPQADPATKRRLLSVLKSHPHFFKAEYLLARWFDADHQPALAAEWRQRCYADAPAIAACRLQDQNGKPIANYTFSYGETYAADNSDFGNYYSWMQSITTDAQGCFYIPVYNTPFSFTTMGWTGANDRNHIVFNVSQSNLNMSTFYPASKVILLPPLVSRPYIVLTSLKDDKLGTQEKPIVAARTTFHVSWKPVVGATKYYFNLTEIKPRKNGGSESQSFLERFYMTPRTYVEDPFTQEAGIRETHYDLPLTTAQFMFNRKCIYGLEVRACNADGDYAQSQTAYFTVPHAIAPIPATVQALQSHLPAGCIVQSVKHVKNEVVVRAQMPDGNLYSSLLNRPWFGQDVMEQRAVTAGNRMNVTVHYGTVDYGNNR